MEHPHVPPSRNSPCPCGSTKRYKDCHGALQHAGQSPAVNDRRHYETGSEIGAERLVVTLEQALGHQSRGDVAAAESLYRAVLDESPEHFDALHMLGVIRYQAGDHEQAVSLLTRAIAVNSHHAPAYSNLGLALHARKNHAQALASLDRALALAPDYPEALNNRGTVLQEIKRHEEALASFDRALALKPDSPEILNNRANALMELRRYDDAAACFAMLLARKPDYDWAIGYLYQCRMNCCDWAHAATLRDGIDAAVRAGKRAITPFAYLAASDSPADQLCCSRIHVAALGATAKPPLAAGVRYGHDRIRLAYLSADFHEHATAYLSAELFELHDRTRFDLTAVSFGPDTKGAMRRRIERAFESFLDVRERADGEVAQMLRDREIDIAVDLTGLVHGGRPRILAYRPCPVQASYLGYPGTLGALHIDYLLADAHVVPAGHEQFYVEKIVRLPDTYQVNDSTRGVAPATPARADLGLPEAGFVFCCFNNTYKITPRIFDVWMRLVTNVPGSVLWLIEDNAAASRNLRLEAARRHVDPARVIFAPRVKSADHLARHRRADLFLDTLPYNAHTTASDALWTGLPVLTCASGAFAGRVAGSLLAAVGLPELVTASLEEYEALALALARTPGRLQNLRMRLAANRATFPLFNGTRFRDHIEAAYVTMWARHERGEPPVGFAVVPKS